MKLWIERERKEGGRSEVASERASTEGVYLKSQLIKNSTIN
jgi:hypothetical protein